MVDIENAEKDTIKELNLCSRKLETLPLNISRYPLNDYRCYNT
jgi:hypothetical protein